MPLPRNPVGKHYRAAYARIDRLCFAKPENGGQSTEQQKTNGRGAPYVAFRGIVASPFG